MLEHHSDQIIAFVTDVNGWEIELIEGPKYWFESDSIGLFIDGEAVAALISVVGTKD